MFLAVFAKRGEYKSTPRVTEPADTQLCPVHALWVYGTKMGIFLFLLVASGFMSNIIVSGWSLSKLDYYERNCLFIGHFPKEIVYLGYVLSFVGTITDILQCKRHPHSIVPVESRVQPVRFFEARIWR
jgi:hypothetical protein